MKIATQVSASILVIAMSLTPAVAMDTGSKDVLRLSDARRIDGEWRVAVHVINDEPLAGLDIPLRFGQPGADIELVRVDFANRVADWDFTHARIDNQAKTVILGLISELTSMRPNADMKVSAEGNTKIADLVFSAGEEFEPEFATFSTRRPGHDLTFIYNDEIEGKLQVLSIVPDFEVNVSFKNGESTLPLEYALSQNFPNPFNPSTNFTLSLPEASDYSLTIFNITGQLVKMIGGHASAGQITITWDGTDQRRNRAASGVYFYRVIAGSFSETRKMVMLK